VFFCIFLSLQAWGQSGEPTPILCNQNQCQIPNVNLTLSVDGNNEFCDGETIMLEINQDQSLDFDYLIYYWCDGVVDTINFQDQPGTHAYIVPDSLLCLSPESTYTIWVIGIKNCANGITCRSAATTLTVRNRPVAEFSAPVEACVNLPVIFSNSSCNETSYLWNFGDGNTTTASDPEHEYDINRSIDVLLVAYNDNGGAFICADSIVRPVEPDWITTFYAPNALSPGYGAEGVQVFKPVGIGQAEYRIAIYSPWGEQIWYSEALEEGQPAESWNGAMHNQGDILPQGAYTWRADLTFVNGVRRTEVGGVTLLR
jgi:hypothetical protein